MSIEAELLEELALALYAQELLSFGKARELANLDLWQFSQLLDDRTIRALTAGSKFLDRTCSAHPAFTREW